MTENAIQRRPLGFQLLYSPCLLLCIRYGFIFLHGRISFILHGWKGTGFTSGTVRKWGSGSMRCNLSLGWTGSPIFCLEPVFGRRLKGFVTFLCKGHSRCRLVYAYRWNISDVLLLVYSSLRFVNDFNRHLTKNFATILATILSIDDYLMQGLASNEWNRYYLYSLAKLFVWYLWN